MKAPLGLVGAALLVWGLSIRLPWLGVAAALLLESLRLAAGAPSARAAALVTPVARACAVLAIAFLIYVLAAQSLPHSLYQWLRWLPLILLPLPALQMLAGSVAASALVRALRASSVPVEDRPVDMTYAYAALVLAAAGTGNGAQAWLYAAYAGIIGWALLARVASSRRIAAAAMLLAASALGYGIHVGLATLQDLLDDWSSELIAEMSAPKPDPFRERTRIGDLGKIKLSDRIVMRVNVEGPRPSQLLLRESALDHYRNGEWNTPRRPPRPAVHEGDRWIVSEGEAPARLALRRTFSGGEGLVPVPAGARAIGGLAAQSVDVYASGAVRARGTPRFISLDVAYDPRGAREAPSAADRAVPELLGPTLAKVIADDRLRQSSDAATVESVRAFFAAKFAYSLDLGSKGRESGRTLADFLLRDRKGHCEYFATATVLLLREAGIPARYVGGFSVQEYSELEKSFVVRARHAHAWAIAYVGGRWVDVDTTPARWAEFEAEQARSFLGPLMDRLSWLFDRIARAWLDASTETLLAWATGGAAIVFAALAVPRLLRRRRARAAEASAARSDALGEAWRSFEAVVGRLGRPREPGETIRQWARRLASDDAMPSWRAEIASMAEDYYRARFDPGASEDDVRGWIDSARQWRPEGRAG